MMSDAINFTADLCGQIYESEVASSGPSDLIAMVTATRQQVLSMELLRRNIATSPVDMGSQLHNYIERNDYKTAIKYLEIIGEWLRADEAALKVATDRASKIVTDMNRHVAAMATKINTYKPQISAYRTERADAEHEIRRLRSEIAIPDATHFNNFPLVAKVITEFNSLFKSGKLLEDRLVQSGRKLVDIIHAEKNFEATSARCEILMGCSRQLSTGWESISSCMFTLQSTIKNTKDLATDRSINDAAEMLCPAIAECLGTSLPKFAQ